MSSKKKRVLPAWMKEQGSHETESSAGKRCNDVLPTCSTAKNGIENSDKSNTVDTLSDDSDNDGIRTIKKRIIDHLDTPTDEQQSDINSPYKTITSESNEDSAKIVDKGEQSRERSISPPITRLCSDDELNALGDVGAESEGASGSKSPSVSTNSTRKSCYYGSSCYRKNPQHRVDFAHPGDPDYCDTASSSSGANVAPDNRPLCEYGSACYRKNPQHRRDYRHDGPSGRKARPAGIHDIPSDDDNGDFNGSISSDDFKPGESESDDSFVTSDSVSNGDSDYDPSDDDDKKKALKKKNKKKELKTKGKRKKPSG